MTINSKSSNDEFREDTLEELHKAKDFLKKTDDRVLYMKKVRDLYRKSKMNLGENDTFTCMLMEDLANAYILLEDRDHAIRCLKILVEKAALIFGEGSEMHIETQKSLKKAIEFFDEREDRTTFEINFNVPEDNTEGSADMLEERMLLIRSMTENCIEASIFLCIQIICKYRNNPEYSEHVRLAEKIKEEAYRILNMEGIAEA